MIASLARLLSIIFRERPVELKPGVRYRVTLDLERVRTGMAAAGGKGSTAADVSNWLLSMGMTPTSQANVWKAEERFLRRVPKAAILRAEKL